MHYSKWQSFPVGADCPHAPLPHLSRLPQLPWSSSTRDSSSHSRVSSLLQGKTGGYWVFSSVGLRCALHPHSRCPKADQGPGVPIGVRAVGQPDRVEVAPQGPRLWVKGDCAASPKLKVEAYPENEIPIRIACSPPTCRNPQKSETQTSGL